MTHSHASDVPGTAGILYVAVGELPATFDQIKEWVEALLQDHPLGFRALIDLSRLGSKKPPRAAYIQEFVAALQPVITVGRNARCALVVPPAWMRRAQFIETMTRGSRLQFRAFEHAQQSMAWLGVGGEEPALLFDPA